MEIEESEDEEELRETGKEIVSLGKEIIDYTVELRKVNPIFDKVFVFNKNVTIYSFKVNRTTRII